MLKLKLQNSLKNILLILLIFDFMLKSDITLMAALPEGDG